LTPLAHLAKLLEKEEIQAGMPPLPGRCLAVAALAAVVTAGLALPIIVPARLVAGLGLPALLGGLWASAYLRRMLGAGGEDTPGSLASVALVLFARAAMTGHTSLGMLLTQQPDGLALPAAALLMLAAATHEARQGALTLAAGLSGPSQACLAAAASVERFIVTALASSHLALGLGCVDRLAAGLSLLCVAGALGVSSALAPRPASAARSRGLVVLGLAVALATIRP
jgi:hypothetical protein